MKINGKSINQVSIEDILAMVDEGQEEAQTLDFKVNFSGKDWN